MAWRFDLRYAMFAAVIFMVEVLIALFVHDRYIRPFVGDTLVVVLLYCAASAVLRTSPIKLALAVFAFAYAIECAQYFQLASILGLSKGSMLYIALGATFDWIDIAAYAVGTCGILWLHKA